MSKISDDDMVTLILITNYNSVQIFSRRKDACVTIKNWFDAREYVKTSPDSPEAYAAKQWLEKGTFAYYFVCEDGKRSHYQTAIAWSQVIGLTIKEYEVDDSQKKRDKASTEFMKKLTEQLDKGDEWKGDE